MCTISKCTSIGPNNNSWSHTRDEQIPCRLPCSWRHIHHVRICKFHIIPQSSAKHVLYIMTHMVRISCNTILCQRQCACLSVQWLLIHPAEHIEYKAQSVLTAPHSEHSLEAVLQNSFAILPYVYEYYWYTVEYRWYCLQARYLQYYAVPSESID